MKLYAVVVDNLGDRKSYAVRAVDPAAAVRQILDAQDGPQYFEQLHVYALTDLAGDASKNTDSVNGAEGLASTGGEA